MKRFVERSILLTVLLALLLALPAMANAATSGTCGDNLTWTLDDEGLLTISGTGEMWDFKEEYFPPTGALFLTAPWGTGVKEVVLEKGVTSIGAYAFHGCSSLRSISLPDGMTSIGYKAFRDCSSLSSISLPDSVTNIGDLAFYGCTATYYANRNSSAAIALTKELYSFVDPSYPELSLEAYETEDGTITFTVDDCATDVVSVTFPEGVTSIGNSAFYDCRSLSSISLPNSVTSIGSSAFYGCSSLSSISLPNSVTSIGSSAFYGCSSLSSISLPDGVISIGSSAFSGCISLSSISIPEGVTSIGSSAFYGCSSLSSISIPEGVTSIGSSAFSGCSSLSSISIPDGVTSIGNYAFRDCSSLSSISIPEGVTSIGSSAFKGCSSLSSISLPEGVTYIGSSAFENCRSLSSINIPDGVTSIGNSAFSYCPAICYTNRNSSAAIALTKASYSFIDPSYPELSLEAYETEDGTITFTVDDCATDVVSVTFPEGVTSIGSSAFYGCSSLSSISIPDGVTSIGSYAFYDCRSLSSISLPDGVTSIGNYAFNCCRSLSSISIPKGVSSICSYTFWGCSSLSSISIPDGVTSIGCAAFRGCYSLSSISLPDGVTSIGDYAFEGCRNLSRINISDGVTSITFGQKAFYDCPAAFYANRNSVAAITLTNKGYSFVDPSYPELKLTAYETEDGTRTLTVIDCAADVVSVTLPDGVTSVSSGAFWGCSSLSSISLPNSVTSIGSSAFRHCSSLSSISLPEGVTSIGSDAFYGCSSLSSISLPDGVTSIGYEAFYECSNLKSISLPDSMTSICSDTFYGCSDLTSVYIPNSVTSIAYNAFSSSSPTIYCYEYSYAETWAQQNGKKYVLLDGKELEDYLTVTLPETMSLTLGEAKPIAYDIFPQLPDMTIVWASSDEDVVTVADGVLTPVGGGNAVVTLTVNGVSASCAVTVMVPVPEITLPETMSLTLGEAKPIAYDIFPQLPDMTIVWASSDEDVVTVADGVLTPVGGGSAVVTLTVNGVSASCTVTVVAPATRLALPEDIYVTAKTTSALPLTIEPAGATCQLVYTTGDSVYALISTDGVVTAGAVGSTTVTVTDQLTGLNASATIHICRPASQVSFAEASCTAHPGEVLQLTVNVTSGSQSLINALVTFASSDESIATVDQNGRLTAKAPGTVTITATASNGVSDSCTVTVKELVRSVLPAGLTSLDSEALTGVAAEWIVLPEGMQTIGSRAFAGCGSLVRVEIPASVTSIADDAFADCGALTIVAQEGSDAHAFAVSHDIDWRDK